MASADFLRSRQGRDVGTGRKCERSIHHCLSDETDSDPLQGRVLEIVGLGVQRALWIEEQGCFLFPALSIVDEQENKPG
ncbi:unnamed protein product [Dovyalis caffra]|uniref:Uncharacterized protein n=1 Tax=Dovyalis caffra TaxID=77055 RepID=A0AAV1SWV1_9ROSI|nr:unnamed protein product [Dovyalis caffra]